MFAQATLQPPLLAGVMSQMSTLIAAARQNIHLARPQAHRSETTAAYTGRHSKNTEEKRSENRKADISLSADLQRCIEQLLENRNLQKVWPMFLTPQPDARSYQNWRSSYISSPTFFENKSGFAEELLYKTSHLNPALLKSISSLTQNQAAVLFTQKRFIGLYMNESRNPVKGTKKRPLGFGFKSKPVDDIDHLKMPKVLTEDDRSVQKKVKLAYTLGFVSGVKSPQTDDKTKMKYGRILLGGLVVLGFFLFLRAQVDGMGKQISDLMNMQSYEIDREMVNVTFADVKGCDEVKEELMDIVSFLKDNEKFEKMGAKLPKGVLLVGIPGTGKTLLAKAVAGEANVPFFHASGSQFDEVFVGSGSKRVRALFEEAKKQAPCIIFIDEIDSVGGKRTKSSIHPYANQTVNQLLAEMDGFNTRENVIVIGATNEKGNLDKALLRPGRFDTQIEVLAPDMEGRKQLFELYLSKIKTRNADIDIDALAALSRGMTGAEIQNMVNQGAIIATLRNGENITMDDLHEARDKVAMGPAWKNKKIEESELLKTAYHEAGHTVVAFYTKNSAELKKVTIQPRGRALGHTSALPTREGNTSKSECLASMDLCMGGRAAEELQYGADNVEAGAASDFERGTMIAKAMVMKWGMSDKVGKRYFDEGGASPQMQELVDREINRLLDEAYERAMNILKSHQTELKRLAEALMKYETLDADEIKAIIEGKSITRRPRDKKKKEEKVKSAPGILKLLDEKDSVATLKCSSESEGGTG
ncbi:ATP-dependent zinc metalloprotease YME1L-like isoform X2 [Mya arenaria]|uniref:ATP-dependent zinc metalloprotease YME1L-like isoform X2 n=1 Tax=Mya arenaria TaxID=6604 RepID=UPI0022E730EE|nr:ATP-dependent zinc metalloprotease YME1L-like isoform X2 [Mya arenaria]